MRATYNVDKEQRWVHTMMRGELSRTDISSALERRLMDEDVEPSFAEIIDLTEFTKSDPSGDDIREVARKKERYGVPQCWPQTSRRNLQISP
jgi:hypothetical protein